MTEYAVHCIIHTDCQVSVLAVGTVVGEDTLHPMFASRIRRQRFTEIRQHLFDACLSDQVIDVVDIGRISGRHASGSKVSACYTACSSMPKTFNAKIGPRDVEILTAIDRTPLTPAQLCRLSETFESPFRDEHNLRRRLRILTEAGLVRSWPYALVTDGRSPRYYKLNRDGYRLLYGENAALPRRRYFEEISHGHHQHGNFLAEAVVHLSIMAQRQGNMIRHFARENSVKLMAHGFTMFPDCAFQIVSPNGKVYNFVVELDNGTERIRSTQDVESIERKIRGYDAHQSQFAADDADRYLVLFLTTRSPYRLQTILSLADALMQNRQRTVFVGCDLETLLASDPFHIPVLSDHRSLRRTLIPIRSTSARTGM
jgi:hypothetical protein